MIHAAYAVGIITVFGWGVSTYLIRRKPKQIDDGTNFAYVRELYHQGKIDGEGFEAMVLLINEDDIEFVRPPVERRLVNPPKRSFWSRYPWTPAFIVWGIFFVYLISIAVK